MSFWSRAVVVCLLASVCAAYIDLGTLKLGSNATIASWGAENATRFIADISGAHNATVEIVLLRRQALLYTGSQMGFCRMNKTTGNCDVARVSHNISLLLLDEEETQITIFVNRTPPTYDTDVPITIYVCDGHCVLECDNACSGHGGCDRVYHTCNCDHHYDLVDKECVKDLSGGNNGVVAAVCVVVIVVVLVLVGICFWGCENDDRKKKDEGAEKKADDMEVVVGDEVVDDLDAVGSLDKDDNEEEDKGAKKDKKKKDKKSKDKKKKSSEDEGEEVEMDALAQGGDDDDSSAVRKRKSGKKGK